MIAVRVLDAAGVLLGLSFLSTLAVWWARPEIVFLILLGVVAFRLALAPVAVAAVAPRRALAVGIAAYASLFSFITLTRHLTFQTHALDLGYYVQLVWNLSVGRGALVSLPEMHAWGDHLSPIVYLFVPAFWAWPSPGVLLVGQSIALALGALPVFGLAHRRLGDERAAAAFAILYLLNPSLHGINVRDFHAAALAIPLLLSALYCAEAGRPWLFAAAAALTLACREDAALPLMGVGVWLMVARRRWLWGAATAAAALAILIVDVRWVIPSYRGEPYPHFGRYARYGRSLGDIVLGLLASPFQIARQLASTDRALYVLALLAPLAFLPVLAPLDLIGALPALAQNLLSSDPILFNYRTQYQSFAVPFLMLAAIDGYRRLIRRRPAWRVAVLVVAAGLSLMLGARTVNSLAVARWWPSPGQRAAYAVLKQVPPTSVLSAQDPYVPHLSLRPLVFVFPVGIERADHVLIDTATYPWRNQPGMRMERREDAVVVTTSDGLAYRYEVVAEAAGRLLLRRL